MKKIVLTLTLVGMMFVCKFDCFAQRPFYHNSGDTIDNMDTIYWIPEWYRNFINDSMSNMGEEHAPAAGSCDVLMKCFTETPIQVIGIASVFSPNNNGSSPDNWPDSISPEQDYLRLYQAYPDTMRLAINLPFNVRDPYRIIRLDLRTQNWIECCQNDYRRWIKHFRIYEKYLEKPVTVFDSFYIGGTMSEIMENHVHYDNHIRYWAINGSSYYGICDTFQCTIPEQTFKIVNKYETPLAYDTLPPGHVLWIKRRSYLYTFPILLIDTTFANPGTEPYLCPQVEHFRAPMTWESGGTLMWDVNARHLKWQVRICDIGLPPDNFFIDTCINVPYYTVEGLQSHTHYSAYVRGVCEHYGDTLYGDWSNDMDLYTIVDISKPDYLNEFVQLLPNPASDIVQVLSSFNIERVEIYDLQGKKVFDSGNVSGVSFSADVKSLNRGAYVVVVHNQQGICTKKLILQ